LEEQLGAPEGTVFRVNEKEDFSQRPWLKVPQHSVKWESGTATLVVVGEVDIASTPLLFSQLAKIRSTNGLVALVIDLASVTFMDASGLTFLITAQKEVQSNLQRMDIVGASGQIQRLFEITGLNSILSVVPSDRKLTSHPRVALTPLLTRSGAKIQSQRRGPRQRLGQIPRTPKSRITKTERCKGHSGHPVRFGPSRQL
jgi:anti-sigma B factor antagonist